MEIANKKLYTYFNNSIINSLHDVVGYCQKNNIKDLDMRALQIVLATNLCTSSLTKYEYLSCEEKYEEARNEVQEIIEFVFKTDIEKHKE